MAFPSPPGTLVAGQGQGMNWLDCRDDAAVSGHQSPDSSESVCALQCRSHQREMGLGVPVGMLDQSRHIAPVLSRTCAPTPSRAPSPPLPLLPGVRPRMLGCMMMLRVRGVCLRRSSNVLSDACVPPRACAHALRKSSVARCKRRKSWTTQ